MMVTGEFLATRTTVVELKAMAKDMGLKGYSHQRKDMLVLMVACQMNILHGEAILNSPPTSDSEKKDDTTIDTFLSEIHVALSPLVKRAEIYFQQAEVGEAEEIDEWWQITKDLATALHNTEWLMNFRNPIRIEV